MTILDSGTNSHKVFKYYLILFNCLNSDNTGSKLKEEAQQREKWRRRTFEPA